MWLQHKILEQTCMDFVVTGEIKEIQRGSSQADGRLC